jgi:hypothetical protein
LLNLNRRWCQGFIHVSMFEDFPHIKFSINTIYSISRTAPEPGKKPHNARVCGWFGAKNAYADDIQMRLILTTLAVLTGIMATP